MIKLCVEMEGGNNNNSPVLERREEGITVMSEGRMYFICFIPTKVSVPAGELLARICSHPETCHWLPDLAPSCMGIRNEHGTLYQHFSHVQSGTTVYLCQTKGIERVTSPSPPLPRLKNEEEKREPKKKWGTPEDYIGRCMYLKDTIDDFTQPEHDYATFVMRHSETQTREVVVRVSENGCRAKLALEMLCLFHGLQRDDWALLNSNVKWILPRQEYVVIPVNPRAVKK